MSEKLSPERAMRLLRAKAAELENTTKVFYDAGGTATNEMIGNLSADIALVAGLLADHMERSEQHDEQLRQMYGFAVDHDVKIQGYLASILEVTEFDVGSKEEADYVAALKAECDAYLGKRRDPVITTVVETDPVLAKLGDTPLPPWESEEQR